MERLIVNEGQGPVPRDLTAAHTSVGGAPDCDVVLRHPSAQGSTFVIERTTHGHHVRIVSGMLFRNEEACTAADLLHNDTLRVGETLVLYKNPAATLPAAGPAIAAPQAHLAPPTFEELAVLEELEPLEELQPLDEPIEVEAMLTSTRPSRHAPAPAPEPVELVELVELEEVEALEELDALEELEELEVLEVLAPAQAIESTAVSAKPAPTHEPVVLSGLPVLPELPELMPELEALPEPMPAAAAMAVTHAAPDVADRAMPAAAVTASAATTSDATTSDATTSDATTSDATTSDATTSDATTSAATTGAATDAETAVPAATVRAPLRPADGIRFRRPLPPGRRGPTSLPPAHPGRPPR